MSEAALLLGVSDDTVRRWVDAGRLAARSSSSGRQVVDGAALARLAVEQATPPTLGTPATESARNRFTGIVTEVVLGDVAAQIEIQAGPFRVVSLISRESAEELALEPGVPAVAVIKSTTVVVETPGASS